MKRIISTILAASIASTSFADMDNGGVYQQAQGTPLDMSLPENQESARAVLGIVGILLGVTSSASTYSAPKQPTYNGPKIHVEPAKLAPQATPIVPASKQ